ncbi:MAG: hypothetical protein AB1638_13285, partial [Nitrospirota bacterium]
MNKKLILLLLSSLGILFLPLNSIGINAEVEQKSLHSQTTQNYSLKEAKIIDQTQSVLADNPPGKPRDYIKDYIPYPGNKYPAPLFLPDSWYFPPIPHQGYINPEDFY